MLKLLNRNGAEEWRYIALDHIRIGTPRELDCAVLATSAHSTALMAATSANRISVSTDGGGSFTLLGTDVTNGFDLGAFTPKQRKNVILKVNIPTGPSREELIGIEFGEGV